tara:strand:+ start:133 stop:1041 length:909 start_codon:yes stop_codon:yes gene_type:complete
MENTNLPSWKQALGKSLPKFEAINPERARTELGFALQLFEASPTLQKCDPTSILNSVVNVARTSITLNPAMRLCYLIPRKGKCILEFSYMGLVAMLRDNNCIRTISATIVYADDEFDYDPASNNITHKPTFAKTEQEHNSREIIGCYSRATLPTNDVVFEFMPMWEIDKVKKMSAGSGSASSAWNTWKDEMIKKSVIKRHFKMLISGNASDALQTALKVENEAHPLINNFTEKKNIMNAFDEPKQPEPAQLSFLDESPAEETKKSPMDMPDDELEAVMQMEAEKVKKREQQNKMFGIAAKKE